MLINHIKKEKSLKKRENSKDIHMFLYGNRKALDREYEIYDHLKRSDVNYKFNTKHTDIERILTSPTLKIQVNQSKPKLIQSKTQRISMVQLKSIYSNRNTCMNNQGSRTCQSRKQNSNSESKSKSQSKEKEKGIIIRRKSKENYNNINVFNNHTHTNTKNNLNTYIKTNTNINPNPNTNTNYLKYNNSDSKNLNSTRQKQSNMFSTQKKYNQTLKNSQIQSNSNEKKKKKGNLVINEENKENTHLFTIKSNSNLNIMNDLYKLQVRTENVLNLYLKVINQ